MIKGYFFEYAWWHCLYNIPTKHTKYYANSRYVYNKVYIFQHFFQHSSPRVFKKLMVFKDHKCFPGRLLVSSVVNSKKKQMIMQHQNTHHNIIIITTN
jgi:hypothetical protein